MKTFLYSLFFVLSLALFLRIAFEITPLRNIKMEEFRNTLSFNILIENKETNELQVRPYKSAVVLVELGKATFVVAETNNEIHVDGNFNCKVTHNENGDLDVYCNNLEEGLLFSSRYTVRNGQVINGAYKIYDGYDLSLGIILTILFWSCFYFIKHRLRFL